MEQCQIEADALRTILSKIQKPSEGNAQTSKYEGLKSFSYYHGIMDWELSQLPIDIPGIAKVVAEYATDTLESLELRCDIDYFWLHGKSASYISTEHNVDKYMVGLTLDCSLQSMKCLKSLMVDPMMLVFGWRSLKHSPSYLERRWVEGLTEAARAVPLANVLPRSLETLSIYNFGNSKFEKATELCAANLVTLLEDNYGAVPNLKHISLSKPTGPRFTDRIQKACRSRGVELSTLRVFVT
jgi:hypothetical protein